MTDLIQANFNGTQVFFQDNAYLNATSIAKRFGKKAKDYLKTEQTKAYIKALLNSLNSKRTKILFEENQLLTVKKGSPMSGGGTWLHPKLAIDFARWLSPDFAVWCDEQIEQILHPAQKRLEDLSTVKTRTPLKDAVNMLVAKQHMTYSDGYKLVHQRFGVGSVEELSNEQVAQAVEYVHTVLCGEYMHQPETKLTEAEANYLYGWGKAGRVRHQQLVQIGHELNELAIKLHKVTKNLHDPIYEPCARLNFLCSDPQASNQRAQAILNNQDNPIRV